MKDERERKYIARNKNIAINLLYYYLVFMYQDREERRGGWLESGRGRRRKDFEFLFSLYVRRTRVVNERRLRKKESINRTGNFASLEPKAFYLLLFPLFSFTEPCLCPKQIVYKDSTEWIAFSFFYFASFKRKRKSEWEKVKLLSMGQ